MVLHIFSELRSRIDHKLREVYRFTFIDERISFEEFRSRFYKHLMYLLVTVVIFLAMNLILPHLLYDLRLLLLSNAILLIPMTYLLYLVTKPFINLTLFFRRVEAEALYAALHASIYMRVVTDHEARMILNKVIELLASKDIVLRYAAKFFKRILRDGGVEALDKYIALCRQKSMPITEVILSTFIDVLRTGQYVLYADRLRDRAYAEFRAKLQSLIRTHEIISMSIVSVAITIPVISCILSILLFSKILNIAVFTTLLIHVITVFMLLMYLDSTCLIKIFDFTPYLLRAGTTTAIIAIPLITTSLVVSRYLDYREICITIYLCSCLISLTFDFVYSRYDSRAMYIFTQYSSFLNRVAQLLESKSCSLVSAILQIASEDRSSIMSKLLRIIASRLVLSKDLNYLISFIMKVRGSFAEFLRTVTSLLIDAMYISFSPHYVRDLARMYDEYVGAYELYLNSMKSAKYVLFIVAGVISFIMYLVIKCVLAVFAEITITPSASELGVVLPISLPSKADIAHVTILSTTMINIILFTSAMVVAKLATGRIGIFGRYALISLLIAFLIFILIYYFIPPLGGISVWSLGS